MIEHVNAKLTSKYADLRYLEDSERKAPFPLVSHRSTYVLSDSCYLAPASKRAVRGDPARGSSVVSDGDIEGWFSLLFSVSNGDIGLSM